jgi:glucokinase
MTDGYPRLLGDIGATNARWAWRSHAGAELQDVRVRPCAENASLIDAAIEYLASTGHPRPRWVAIGVATAVTGDQVRMTNHPWAFSIAALQRSLAAERCLVINDFTALAHSLPLLGRADLRALGGGAPAPGMPLAVLGPGTGLGVSALLPGIGGDAGSVLSGEGGHVTLAAADDEEAALLALLRLRFGHVSAERVLSGPGLINLYQALCALVGQTPQILSPAELARAAIEATDPACVRTVARFTSFLGGVAGNLVLTLGARGGVYIGGGIVPRLGTAFDAGAFRARFEDKGRFAGYLQGVPAWLITASTPALLGADRALDAGRG